MLVLLDQNVPIGVRRILASHDVRTAHQMGWAHLSNGELLDAAEAAGIAVLVTCDQNIVFQQSLAGRRIAVVVLATNRWVVIRAQPRRIENAVTAATAGSFSVVRYGGRRGRTVPGPTL
jgi:predicted nuclease of predicted toxin-antitoxin system